MGAEVDAFGWTMSVSRSACLSLSQAGLLANGPRRRIGFWSDERLGSCSTRRWLGRWRAMRFVLRRA